MDGDDVATSAVGCGCALLGVAMVVLVVGAFIFGIMSFGAWVLN